MMTGKKKLKGHGSGHTQCTRLQLFTQSISMSLFLCMCFLSVHSKVILNPPNLDISKLC